MIDVSQGVDVNKTSVSNGVVSGLPPDLDNPEKALNFEMDLENLEN